MSDIEAHPRAVPFPFGPEGLSWEEALASQGLSDGQSGVVSSPVEDPQNAYPEEPGLRTRDFELPPGGLTEFQRRRALTLMELYLAEKHEYFMGYQANQDMDGYPQDIQPFLKYHVNNLGDPFTSGGFKINSKIAERAVMDYYATLWHARWPHNDKDPESYWGYMLSMGATEGNLYALWNARDYLAGRELLHPDVSSGQGGGAPRWAQASVPEGTPKALDPVAFYSEDTHYSFAKGVRVLDVRTFQAVGDEHYPGECPLPDSGGTWPAEVPSRSGPSGTSADGPGDIDVDALAVLVEFFAAKGHPILISLNYGSTFKCAYDDVRAVSERLLPVFEEHGLIERELTFHAEGTREALTRKRRGFWIHVDGALGAGYAPFQRMAYREKKFGWTPDVDLPEFDFGLVVPSEAHGPVDMVSSIALSGHKWPGAPWTCGIYMTKVKYQLEPPSRPGYIGALDTTFAGSRNGMSPLVLWDHLARHSYQDQVDRIRKGQDLAERLYDRLRRLERDEGLVLWPDRTKGALTVRFRKPSQAMVDKWSLSTEDVNFPGDDPGFTVRRPYAHVFTMPGITAEQVDEFVADIAKDPEILKPPTARAVSVPPTVRLTDGTLSLGSQPVTGRGFH